MKKALLLGILFFVLACLVLSYQLVRFQYAPIYLSQHPQNFIIESGSNIKSIAQKLSLEKIIDDPWLFILMARIKGLENSLRAGEYQLVAEQTSSELLDTFTRGLSIQYNLTIIEGWTFRQLLSAISKNSTIQNTLKEKTNDQIMALLDLPEKHPEGLFFPDTYSFPKGTTDASFLRRAYQLMKKHLDREWQNRADDIPVKTPYEALILASIVEKETGAAFERPLIAGVFTQRLRKGMRLQTDPTVIYGMGDDFDGDIRFRDLKKDTPYNTYTRKGLTPTPIALPGLDAIKAVLHPESTKALYFVAKGDGTHKFSETLEEHNKAVSRYQLNGKKPRRKSTAGDDS
ncbi:MAG: endolytic transglycosylase MltG [Gammaproteobacteria bacterium]|nr:endolytic transglycosylase MltG [Gammaproteobacteria bacterium]